MTTFGLSANYFISYLAAPLTQGGSETTIYLSSLETLTGEIITTSNFAVFGKGEITIDPLSQVSIENASFTGVDNTNIALTGVTRGLSAVGGDTSTARAIYHPIGTLVIIAFGIQTMENFIQYINTFTGGYSANIVNGESGSALTKGQWVYFNTSTQQWNLTDADVTTTFINQRIGVVQTTVASSGQTIGVAISGVDATQSGLTPGSKYYLSNTTGAVVATTDQTNIVFVGWAISATTILLSYRFDTAGSPYLFNAQYVSTLFTTTVTLDWNKSNVQEIILANGGQTFTFANPQSGGRYVLILQQPSSGAAGTVTWPTIKWTGGVAPTLTATKNKKDVISIIYDGTDYLGTTSYNF
jgi:hypothetical protein